MSVCLCNLSADKALELVAQHELEVGPATPDLDSFSGDVALAKEALGDVFDGRLSQSLKLGPIVRTIRIFTRNCALIAFDIVQQ